MEWKEVEPRQNNWGQQWNLTAYNGEHTVGSIILDDDGKFYTVIDGTVEWMDVADLEEAKKEFCYRLDAYLEGEIDYYNDLRDKMKKLMEIEI